MTIVYTATPDETAWADDPREWDTGVNIRIFRTYVFNRSDKREPLHAADVVFDRLVNADVGDYAALLGARRYARLCDPAIGYAGVYYLRGYSQGDWWDVVAYGPDESTVCAVVEQFEQWLRGDVWTVTAWREKTCDMGEVHREYVGFIGGIYADDGTDAITRAVIDHLIDTDA